MCCEAYHPCFDFVGIGRGTAPAVVGSSLAVILQSDRTMFYHPCFDFVGIGRGTATAVVGSSLAVILQSDRTIFYHPYLQANRDDRLRID